MTLRKAEKTFFHVARSVFNTAKFTVHRKASGFILAHSQIYSYPCEIVATYLLIVLIPERKVRCKVCFADIRLIFCLPLSWPSSGGRRFGVSPTGRARDSVLRESFGPHPTLLIVNSGASWLVNEFVNVLSFDKKALIGNQKTYWNGSLVRWSNF